MKQSEQFYSVIITSYKRDVEIVMRAVQSIRVQTNQNYEIILVDDNPDGNAYSQALQSAFANKDPKIIYVKQNGNQGACAARNLGISYAKAEYIGFLDDDDTWEPEKAQKQLAKFTDPSIGMVYCLGNMIDESVSPTKVTDYYTSISFREEVTFQNLLLRDNIGSTSQALIRKVCFEECGGFDEQLPARQDYEMWLRISRKFRIVGVNEKLFNHYDHGEEQITKSPKKAMDGFLKIHRKYREDYRKNLKAEEVWLTWFERAAKRGRSPMYLLYGVKLFFVRKYLLFKKE